MLGLGTIVVEGWFNNLTQPSDKLVNSVTLLCVIVSWLTLHGLRSLSGKRFSRVGRILGVSVYCLYQKEFVSGHYGLTHHPH